MDPLVKVLLAFGAVILSLITLVVTVGVLSHALPLQAALATLAAAFTGVLGGIGASRFANKNGDKK